jgi:hypothetical protein
MASSSCLRSLRQTVRPCPTLRGHVRPSTGCGGRSALAPPHSQQHGAEAGRPRSPSDASRHGPHGGALAHVHRRCPWLPVLPCCPPASPKPCGRSPERRPATIEHALETAWTNPPVPCCPPSSCLASRRIHPRPHASPLTPPRLHATPTGRAVHRVDANCAGRTVRYLKRHAKQRQQRAAKTPGGQTARARALGPAHRDGAEGTRRSRLHARPRHGLRRPATVRAAPALLLSQETGVL